jgi:hypothetical protein
VSRVSYQVSLDRPVGVPPAFEALDPGAIDTRKRDATVRISVDLSKRQARWLKNAAAHGADQQAVIRALVDLGTELNIDWAQITKSSELRAAVQAAVLIRRVS